MIAKKKKQTELEKILKKFGKLSSLRIEAECERNLHGRSGKLAIAENKIILQEPRLYMEFEQLVKQDEVSVWDLHNKIEGVSRYGRELYKRAFKHNPDIFSEEQVENLCTILANFQYYEERVYLDMMADHLGLDKCEKKKDKKQKYEYPLWSLEFILELNPSLINEKSFDCLLEALDAWTKTSEMAREFGENIPPDPTSYFKSLLGCPEKYAELLLKSEIEGIQLNHLVENKCIDAKLVLEAEKYLTKEETKENALKFFTSLSGIDDEFYLMGMRNQIELAASKMPFVKDVPKENFSLLTKNINKYKFHKQIGIPLAFGRNEISKEKLAELKKVARIIEDYNVGVQYYVASAILNGKWNVSVAEDLFVFDKKQEHSLIIFLNRYSEFAKKITSLKKGEVNSLKYILNEAEPQESNWLGMPESKRFKGLMEKLEDIIAVPEKEIKERLGCLKTFEKVRGDIDPEIYASLLAAPDRNSFNILYDRMQNENLYEFVIETSILSEKPGNELEKGIKNFRNKYLEKGPQFDYSEEGRMKQIFYYLINYRAEKNIDVITHIAQAFDLNPFAVSKETVNERYKAIAQEVHPDVKDVESDEKFKIISDGKNILLMFIDERDRKLKEVYGSILPVKIEVKK